MPLKLNVGLSRKVGEANYGSRGASINVELEVDGSLVTEPAKLQEKIRQLYGLVRTSLVEELNGGNGHSGNGSGHTNGEGTGNGARKVRPATQSQVRAIRAIAQQARIDLATYLHEHQGVSHPEDLDLKAASQVIDDLKEAPAGRQR